MNFYIAGPMTGYANFNYPAFEAAAALIREAGHDAFSPAERDTERHGGTDISLDNPYGSQELAAAVHGFNLRDALNDDLVYICQEATAIYMLSGWENSKGARAEHATAVTLGHKIVYQDGALERA